MADHESRPPTPPTPDTRGSTAAGGTSDAPQTDIAVRRFVLDAAALGLITHDPDSGLVALEGHALQHFDLDATPCPIAELYERVHPDDRSRLQREVATALTTPASAGFDTEFRTLSRDGRTHLLHLRAHIDVEGPIEARRTVRLLGTTQDITARKDAERSLHRFMQASTVIVYGLAVEPERQRLIRLEGDIERLTGWRASEVDSGDWWALNIHPDDRERVLAMNPAPYTIDHLAIDFRFRRRDGSYMWIHDERRLLRDASGTPAEVVGTWSDVTARVELETQLRQSQKLEAIGQLAGGIAHDFNNLLTVIIGTSELLAGSLRGDDERLELVTDIRTAGERAATLTQQLLAFSRKQVLQPTPVDVNEAIEGLERMLRRLIGETITMRCDLEAGVGFAVVDPGQFQQVLMNLAVNARDAMPRGGSLTVSTTAVDAATIPGAPADVTPGRHICITIADTGCGMTPEVLEHIFEPFFTTKPLGHGTGLGLATVFGIVTQSGGHIGVSSEPARGTTFRVYLPSAAAPTDAGAPPSQLDGGHETILLVDDEDGVRRVTSRTLSRRGYTVLEASTPHAALACAAGHGRVDLLLTDVVMPEMSGPALALALRAQQPTLKVLFMSGYVDDAMTRAGVEQIPHALLVKPFSARELAERVRQTLDAAEPL